MKLILDGNSPVERVRLPIFAPLFPMKHAFCLTRWIFSLFSLPLSSPSFVLTTGQRDVSLSFLFACFYLVAYPGGSWVQEILAFHSKHHHAWAVADAWDAVFPSDIIPPAGRIPERDPFMTPSFTQYAMSLPLVDRYTASLSTPYHRSKALVIQLYPRHVHAVLPRTKQLFSRSFEAYQQRHLNVERCIASGLICKEQLDACRDASLLRTVQAIEQWMIGAEQRGATVTE